MLIFFSGEKTKNLHIFIAFYFEILIHYACVVVFWYNIGLDSGWVWVYMGVYMYNNNRICFLQSHIWYTTEKL